MQMVDQTTDLGDALARTLTAALESHNHVLWLVPGGSNITISVDAMQRLDPELTKKLVIMQTDERYVPLDSPDCNWKQLRDAGFGTKYASTYPILTPGASRDDVVRNYIATVQREFAAADYIIGQFGAGADGHIAGIKPESSASTTDQLVAGYEAEDFNRVTLTFAAIQQIDEAIAFIYGADKHPMLAKLANESHPLPEFPMGVLQTISISTVYTDYSA